MTMTSIKFLNMFSIKNDKSFQIETKKNKGKIECNKLELKLFKSLQKIKSIS
jgi:hypothetical protein